MRFAPRTALLVGLATVALSSRAKATEPETPAAAPPSADRPAAAAPPAAETSEEPSGPQAPETGTIGTTVKNESLVTSPTAPKESKLPFRNSTLRFEQSVSTQTAGLETSPQLTYVPVYEWWLSFRPRYYFSDNVFLRMRFDYYKEFTNSAQTTYYRENVFGDVWADLAYDSDVPAISKHTHAQGGLRFRFPTSKESQDQGEYLDTGLFGGAFQDFVLRGESAKVLPAMRIRANAWYDHWWSRATTPTNPSLDYTREDTGAQSFLSDQLSGVTLDAHRLLLSGGLGLWITSKLSLDADLIFINHWHYAETANQCVATLTGCAPVSTTPGFGNTYTVDTWFLAALSYDLVDEVTLSLGYYNLANELAPDGQRRGLLGQDNIWWSPSARVFFEVVANLDHIYEWATGTKTTHTDDEYRRNQASRQTGPTGLTGPTGQGGAGL